jgi:hypothetical protein
MDISFSAFAALLGAAIGGLTSGLASWVTHRIRVRTQWLAQDTLRRQELYKEFIEAAAKCYAGALQHEQPGFPPGSNFTPRRLLSSPRVVALAEQVGQKIIDTYLEPNKTFLELRDMIDTKASDILNSFSEACREEFDSVRVDENCRVVITRFVEEGPSSGRNLS